MPAMYEIHWLPNGPIEPFAGSRGNYYEFSDSDHLDLQSTPVWCHRCGRVTHGEDLSSVEELDEQIRDLNDPTSEAYRSARYGILEEEFGTGEQFRQEYLEKLRRRRTWRDSRISPPKCIRCGSTDILALPCGEAVASPLGNGAIRVECIGMCSTVFNEWFFTPEGDRIPRDTKPTYWSYPEADDPEKSREFL